MVESDGGQTGNREAEGSAMASAARVVFMKLYRKMRCRACTAGFGVGRTEGVRAAAALSPTLVQPVARSLSVWLAEARERCGIAGTPLATLHRQMAAHKGSQTTACRTQA